MVATTRTKSAGYTETVDVEVVQVTTTVTDASGVFVQGLTRDKFRVREDGVLQKLTAFAGENIPLEVVVAVDVSESMTDAMPTLEGRGAEDSSARCVRPIRSACSPSTTTSSRWRGDRPIRRCVSRPSIVFPRGAAPRSYDAILTAIGTVGKQPGRRALVVFTDGEDQNSVSTIKRVADAPRNERRDDLHHRSRPQRHQSARWPPASSTSRR